ncbi:hypothetical protein FRC09_019653 [Ceratobasidium sp. 395]|nr:hypothetical protein FRC09_019653 [Ceratobasidium sp. 395]
MAYHGVAPQRTSFSAILHTLHRFLQDRPRECVVVSLKQEDFAKTPWWVFSRCVREEIERGSGGIDMWWLNNRIPMLGEARGRCVMLSRFGGEGQGWDRGLEGMGIHPTEWPDSAREGFEWYLKGTTVRTHDWYNIPSLLSLPEKAALCIQNLVPTLTDPPTLGITYLSAAGGALSLPPFCALGFGWPSWGLGVEGMNSRVARWLLGRLTASSLSADKERDRWSIQSDASDTRLLGGLAEDEPKRPNPMEPSFPY